MLVSKGAVVFAIAAPILAVAGIRQSEADQVRATEHQRLRSIVNADMQTAGRLHADDFELITPTGETVSKEEHLTLIASGDVDYLVWEPEEIDLKLYDGAAVMRYRARLEISVRGQPDAPSGRFWHTDLYEKRGGQWQVVWSQATETR